MNNEVVPDDPLTERIQQQLIHWDEDLPPSVAGRLRAARRDALNSVELQPEWRLGGLSGAGLGFASLFVMLLTLTVVLRDSAAVIEIPDTEDMVMLSSEDDFELFRDVDFLFWLAQQDDADLG